MRLSALAFLMAAIAAAQPTQQQVFHFEHTPDARSAQELATSIRTILEPTLVKLSDDNPPSTLTVGGTADQLKAAAWIFTELDQSSPSGQMHEYRLSGTPENVIQVNYVPNAQTVQQFQEIATAVRTVVEIRRVFTYNGSKAFLLRGTQDQAALADWLLPLMDRPLGQTPQHSVSPQQTIPDPKEEGVTQVFYVANAPTVQSFQELATTLRTITQVRRVFTYNAAQAIVVRDTASKMAMAEWLFNELDRPAGASAAASAEFRATGPDDIVRVFNLTHGGSGADIQTIVPQIRATTSVQRALNYAGRSMLILRGTAAQMAAADHLVQELDK